MKLYVGNLSYDSNEDSIKELFEEYGEVLDVYMPIDRDYGGNRGFSFVTMAAEAAEKAIDEVDGLEFDGRCIRVNAAQASGGSRKTRADGDSWDNE